jgi:hypothetical protein
MKASQKAAHFKPVCMVLASLEELSREERPCMKLVTWNKERKKWMLQEVAVICAPRQRLLRAAQS